MSYRWTNCFGPISYTRLPAWSRISSTTRSSNSISGTIMKRVGRPQRRQPRSLADLSRKPQSQQAASEEPTRVVRRRLESYQPTKRTAEQGGRPLTKLEIASIKVQAKCKLNSAAFYPQKLTLCSRRCALYETIPHETLHRIPTEKQKGPFCPNRTREASIG